MAISDKLEYLNGTKQLLKDKINNLGGSIDDNTTFRQYANQLQNVYDNLPKTEYQEGTEINLGKTIKGKLDFENGVVGIGQTEQYTTTGSQLIDTSSFTQSITSQGITVAPNGDGTFRVYGTASANVNFIIAKYTFTSGNKYTITNGLTDNQYGKYTLLMSTYAQWGQNTLINGEYSTFTAGTSEEFNILIQVYSGTTLDVVMKPLMYSGGYSSSKTFEQYTGGQASPNPSYPQTINSVTGNQDVVVSGKNLFNSSNVIENALVNAQGLISTINECTTIWAKVKPNTTYTFSRDKGDRLVISGSNTQPALNLSTTIIDNVGVSEATEYTFNSGNFEYVAIYVSRYNSSKPTQMQIEKGSTATTYEPYITPTSYQLSLGDIELNAIGNYKDELVTDRSTGKWYKLKNVEKITLNGTEEGWNKNSTRYSFNISGYETGVYQIYCNYFFYVNDWTSHSNTPNSCIIYREDGWDNARISFNASGIASVTDRTSWKAWLSTHNTIVCYPLATPTLIEITDTTLINQLENWYNAKSFNGTVLIQGNGNLPMIIKVRGLKGE